MKLLKRLRREVLRVHISGGWGDMLLCTPAIKALKERYPTHRLIVYIPLPDREQVFLNNPYIDKVCTTSLLKNPVASYLFIYKVHKFINLRYSVTNPSLFPRERAVDIIASLADVELKERRIQMFLTDEEDQTAKDLLMPHLKRICIHISSTGRNKVWNARNWELLVASMPEFSFIQLGGSGDVSIKGAVDLRGRTSFRVTAAIVRNCHLFVGVDSSLAHITNAFDVPGVVLFGPSTPVTWGHDNNINIYKGIRCAPCIDILQNNECPYGRKCMELITVEEVRQALLSQIQKKSCPDGGLQAHERAN